MFYRLGQFLRSERTRDIATYSLLTIGAFVTAILYLASAWAASASGDDSFADLLLALVFLAIGVWCLRGWEDVACAHRVFARLPLCYLKFRSSKND